MHSRRVADPGRLIPLRARCTSCQGAGKIEQYGVGWQPIGGTTCDQCDGTGRKRAPKRRARLSANI